MQIVRDVPNDPSPAVAARTKVADGRAAEFVLYDDRTHTPVDPISVLCFRTHLRVVFRRFRIPIVEPAREFREGRHSKTSPTRRGRGRYVQSSEKGIQCTVTQGPSVARGCGAGRPRPGARLTAPGRAGARGPRGARRLPPAPPETTQHRTNI